MYLEAAAAPKKKPQPKSVKAKAPGSFHDKLDQKLAVISKKFGVKLTLQRNKTKLSTVTVSGLKAMTFDKVAQLFAAIPNTSHVPNKIGDNTAVFRVFGKPSSKTLTAGSDEYMDPKEKKELLHRTQKALKDTHEKYKKSKDPGEKAYLKRVRKSLYDNVKMFKMIADDEPQYIITAKKNGKRVYWKDDGFTALTAKDAEPLDEETADKIERRLQNKDGYTEVKSVPAVMTADDDTSDDNTSDDSSDDTSDDSSDDSGDDSDDSDDSGDDEDSAEDTSNKADMVKFINDNKISKDSLGGLIDKAASAYTDSLKNDSSVEDIVDFVYSMLGPDDSKAGLKALANKASMNTGT